MNFNCVLEQFAHQITTNYLYIKYGNVEYLVLILIILYQIIYYISSIVSCEHLYR